jgi:hypothetical protein
MKQAIHHLRTSDPVLSAIIERVGDYGIQFRQPDFETLVKSIVFQQLSGRVASVIFGRLAAAVKGVVTPESILKLRPSRMRTLGLSETAHHILARHTGRVQVSGSPRTRQESSCADPVRGPQRLARSDLRFCHRWRLLASGHPQRQNSHDHGRRALPTRSGTDHRWRLLLGRQLVLMAKPGRRHNL